MNKYYYRRQKRCGEIECCKKIWKGSKSSLQGWRVKQGRLPQENDIYAETAKVNRRWPGQNWRARVFLAKNSTGRNFQVAENLARLKN